MFTGIIEELGIVQAITSTSSGVRLEINASRVLEDTSIGDSIAVNGCCLTVVHKDSNCWTADLLPETLHLTNLSELKKADIVNLEAAARIGDRIGGHLVQGHIDSIGKIVDKVSRNDNSWLITVTVPTNILKYIVKKGSIAVDGVSLTVVDVSDQMFSFAMIPHTSQVTTLGRKGPGSSVNIETDPIAKYIEKLMPKANL